MSETKVFVAPERVVAFLILLTFSSTGFLVGGERLNIRGTGMAGSSAAVARGLDAIGINPANLAVSNDVMTLTILPVGASAGSDFLTYDLYSRYLKNTPSPLDLPDAGKQELLNSLQERMGNAYAEGAFRLFGLTLRLDAVSSIAFAVDYSLAGAASVPPEYVRLLLYGNTPGESFNVQDLRIETFWSRSYSVSWGRMLPSPAFLSWLSCGVGVKLVQGYGYLDISKFATALHASPDGMLSGEVDVNIRRARTAGISDPLGDLFQDPAGYGVGVDIGVAGGVGEYFSFGMSLTDIGSITWTRETEELVSTATVANQDPEVFRNIRSVAQAVTGGKWSQGSFSSRLPGIIRGGVAFQLDKFPGGDALPGELLIAADYMQGTGSGSPLGRVTKLSFGIEYKPVHWLPIRTGFSQNGRASRVAFGFGVNFRAIDIDVGTDDLSWLLQGKDFSAGSIGFGMRVKVAG